MWRAWRASAASSIAPRRPSESCSCPWACLSSFPNAAWEASKASALARPRDGAPSLARYMSRPMADEPAYLRAFKDFTRGDLSFDNLPKLESEVYGTSDRASAVILGSVLESSLTTFLRRKLRPDLNRV